MNSIRNGVCNGVTNGVRRNVQNQNQIQSLSSCGFLLCGSKSIHLTVTYPSRLEAMDGRYAQIRRWFQ